MNIIYFKTTTLEEVKKEYKTLIKKYHPDNKNGNLEVMKIINNEYEYIIKNVVKFSSQKEQAKEVKFSTEIYNILSKIINIANINIEVVGTWIWIDGNTYSVKEYLKSLGFNWSKGKRKWYFTTDNFTPSRYKQKDYNTLKSEYGYTKVDSKEMLRIAN
jgi:hypothetical protein